MLSEDNIRKIAREEIDLFNDNIIKYTEDKKVTKKKREPSKWNIFLKEGCSIPTNEMPMAERAKACSIEYKELKDKPEVDPNELQDI